MRLSMKDLTGSPVQVQVSERKARWWRKREGCGASKFWVQQLSIPNSAEARPSTRYGDFVREKVICKVNSLRTP